MFHIPLLSVLEFPVAAVDTESVSKQRTVAPETGRLVAAADFLSLLKRLFPLLLLLFKSVPLNVAFATVSPSVVVSLSVVFPPVTSVVPPPPLQPEAISVPAINRVIRAKKIPLFPKVLISIYLPPYFKLNNIP